MSAPDMLSPLARPLQVGTFGAEDSASRLAISEQRVDIAQLIARSGRTDALANAASSQLQLKLPKPGYSSTNAETTAIWIAPDTWLVARPRSRRSNLASELRAVCSDAAAVVDQSCGKTVLRLSGDRVRDVLAKGCRIDLHPRVFGSGRAAVTPMAQVHSIVVQVDATPTFDLIVPTTLAEHAFEWLCLSAAEFGYEVCA